jgi:site-specific DNA-methyltransferase (adenine-specific)/site-specific DNA-methyltransferase (cytosine-N4-specific)
VGQGEEDPRLLTRHPANPKIHTAEQDAVVEGSLDEVGWLRRVLKNVVTGHVLDGDERIELAIRAGEATVPVDYCEVPAEKEGFVLRVLDQSAALAQPHLARWAALHGQGAPQSEALRAFFAAQAAQYGVAGAAPGALGETRGEGVGEGELALSGRGEALQAAWGTASGQLWSCGAHYLWCGDSTQADGWAVLRERVGAVRGCITSPPYAEQRASAYGGVPSEGYVAWFRPVAGYVWEALAADGSLFLNLKEHSEGIVRPVYVHELVVTLVREQGWRYVDEFCWERPGVPGDPEVRGKFKNMWEPVFWLAKQARPVFHPERVRHRSEKAIIDTNYQPGLDVLQGSGRDFIGGDGRKGPGWAYPGNRLPTFGSAEALGQPAAFPVGLPQWFVEVYSEVGDWWVDPFVGSGSTLMGCERTGRRAFGMERAPAYVAITLERYSQATGERPVLVD